jgi:kumamolisin
VPPAQVLHLIIGLTPRHQDQLATFLRARRQRRSALYGATLTPAQFAARFGASVEAQNRIVAYMRASGLRVLHTYSDRLLLDVAGTASQIGTAFHTSLVRYGHRHRGQGQPSPASGYPAPLHFANATQPRLPATLAASVNTVIGLADDAPVYRPSSLHLFSARDLAPRAVRPPAGLVRRNIPADRSANAQDAPPANLLTPAEIQSAYAITPVPGQSSPGRGAAGTVPITGTGQTVALFELSPFDPGDVATYDAAFGLTTTAPISVPVDGGATDAFGTIGRVEVALDIELLHAVAPGARTLVYSGPGSPTSNDNTGADDVYARIVNDNRAQVLGTSWGQCEPDQQADSPPDLALLHNLFAQAVAQGMTVVAATGDSGANDCTDGKPNPSVDYPASDPNVLAVGGTVLTLTAGGQVASETGWSGSGGGASRIFPHPIWQAGPGLPPSPMRQVPDVALNAGTAYAVREAGTWWGAGGTSAGAPAWAALLALADDARYRADEEGGAPAPARCAALPGRSDLHPAFPGLGDVHPALYQIAATPYPTPPLRDITTGDGNGAGTPGPGWDAVTGLGVPDGAALVHALLARPGMGAPTSVPCASASPTATATPSPSGTATDTVMPSSSPTAGPNMTGTAALTTFPSPVATSTPPLRQPQTHKRRVE